LVQQLLRVIGATTETSLGFSDSSQDIRFSDLLLLSFDVVVGIFRLDSGVPGRHLNLSSHRSPSYYTTGMRQVIYVAEKTSINGRIITKRLIPLSHGTVILASMRTVDLRNYRAADTFLAQQGRKQTRKHVRDARNFNSIETRAVIEFFYFFLQGKAPKEIHAIFFFLVSFIVPPVFYRL